MHACAGCGRKFSQRLLLPLRSLDRDAGRPSATARPERVAVAPLLCSGGWPAEEQLLVKPVL